MFTDPSRTLQATVVFGSHCQPAPPFGATFRRRFFFEPEGMSMKLRVALLASVLVVAAFAPATAVEPVGAPEFNIKTSIDLKALTTANFYEVLQPAAKAEG